MTGKPRGEGGREPGSSPGRPRRIAFVSFTAYPLFDTRLPFRGGGAEIQLYQAAGEFARDRDFEVSFVVGDFGQPVSVRQGAVRVVKGDRPPRWRVKYLVALVRHWRFLRTLRGLDPDLIIQRAAGAETGLCALYGRLRGKRFIYMVAHEIDCNGEFIRRGGWSGRLFRFGLEHADLVIAQNASQADMIQERHGRRAVIWKGGFPVPERMVAEEEKKDYVLWVARLVPFKQPELAIEVARRCPEARLVMVGQASEDADYAAGVAAAARGVPNIEFIPGMPFGEIDRLYREARVFLNTSSAEGWPNTFMQAAMHATPIVSLRVDPDGFLRSFGCGFCAGGDMDRLAGEVRLLLGDREAWRKKSARAREYFLAHHDLGRNIEGLKEIVRRTLAGGEGRG